MNPNLKTLNTALRNLGESLDEAINELSERNGGLPETGSEEEFAAKVGALALRTAPDLAARIELLTGLFSGLCFSAKLLLSPQELDALVRASETPESVWRASIISAALETKTPVLL